MLNLNFTPFPGLTTVRLILRRLKPEDRDEIFFLRTSTIVNRFLNREKPTSIEDAINFITKIENGIANNNGIYWAITRKGIDTLIGTICLFGFDTENDTAEIGYELNPDFQGQGVMQEAISAVIKFGFDNMRIKTITAFTAAGNEKSVNLLKRNNFQPDTNFEFAPPGELKDLIPYYLRNINTGKNTST